MYIAIPNELITYFASVFAGIDWSLSAPLATTKAIHFQLTDPFVPCNSWEISSAMFASFHLLGSWFTARLFLPPSFRSEIFGMFHYSLSLHLTILIQSIFDSQGEFMAMDLSLLQHWSDCCVNGELSEMALSHPHCLLIMSNHVNLFLSRLFVVRQPFSLPLKNVRRYYFDCVGPRWVHPHLRRRACLIGYWWPHLELSFETCLSSFILILMLVINEEKVSHCLFDWWLLLVD